MKIDISATNFDLTEAIKNHTTDKFIRLEKHSSHLRHLHIILKKEKQDFRVEAILKFERHNDIVVHADLRDLYQAVDKCFERVKQKLDRTLNKDHRYH